MDITFLLVNEHTVFRTLTAKNITISVAHSSQLLCFVVLVCVYTHVQLCMYMWVHGDHVLLCHFYHAVLRQPLINPRAHLLNSLVFRGSVYTGQTLH